jgi:hypothetical protein
VESFIHWLDLCGGGTLRDLLLDRGAVSWVTDPSTIVLCFAVAGVLFFTAHHFESRFQALLWADAVGLAVFCVGGAEIALSAGAPALVAVLMGVMTATFGGILRDVLCAEVPLILRREIYATAAGGRRDHLCRPRDGGSRLDRTGRGVWSGIRRSGYWHRHRVFPADLPKPARTRLPSVLTPVFFVSGIDPTPASRCQES